ncbi:V [Crotalus paramyxovirus]|nr:V [Crotalus paramyxovirus] [Crotalus paramyxovirus]
MANFNGFEASSLIDQGLDDIEAIGQMTCIRPSEESPYVEIPDTGIVPGIVGKAIGEIESQIGSDSYISTPTPHNTIKNKVEKVKRPGDMTPNKVEDLQSVHQLDKSKVNESNITMNPDSRGLKQLFSKDTDSKTNLWKDTISGSMMNHKDESKPGIRGASSERGRPNRGHRREISTSTIDGIFEVWEFCNPMCSRITPDFKPKICTCGECPRYCPRCKEQGGIRVPE